MIADGFLKFRDTTTMSGPDIADALAQMKAKGRFKELLFIVDTCQAATLFEPFKTPDIVAIGSSIRGESSYSYTHDSFLGVAVIDRFTYYLLRYIQTNGVGGSLQRLFESFKKNLLLSTVFWSSSLSRPLSRVPASDFFGSVLEIKGDNATSQVQVHKPRDIVEDSQRLEDLTWGEPGSLYPM